MKNAHNVLEQRKQKNHKWKECPYVTKYSAHLKVHITQVHTTERQYRCEQCGKGFVRCHRVWSFVLFNDIWSQKRYLASNTTAILASSYLLCLLLINYYRGAHWKEGIIS